MNMNDRYRDLHIHWYRDHAMEGKMKRTQFLAGIFVVGCAISGNAISEDRITTCDACNASQFPNAALSVVSYGSEYVYVVNRGPRVIKRFFVIKESEPGYSIAEATEVSTEPAVVEDINAVLDFHEGVTASKSVPFSMIPMPSGHGVDSALDIIYSSNRLALEQGVHDHVTNNFMALVAGVAINDPASIADLLNGGAGFLTVEFPNGSKYTFKIEDGTELSGDGAVVLVDSVEGSGIDANGKPIPESSSDLPGINRSGPGVSDYVDLANRMGVDVGLSPSCNAVAEFSCQIIGNNLDCSYKVTCQ